MIDDSHLVDIDTLATTYSTVHFTADTVAAISTSQVVCQCYDYCEPQFVRVVVYLKTEVIVTQALYF